MSKFWNGYRWVDMTEAKTALLEAELNPREVTEEFPIPEQPSPNMVSIAGVTVQKIVVQDPDQFVQEIEQTVAVPESFEMRFQRCEVCDSEYDTLEGDCPVCLMLYGTAEEIAAHVAKVEP